MRMIEAMMLTQRYAKKWAGQVVGEMIKGGADKSVMRRHGIPQSVFYCVLGGRRWQRQSPAECAQEMINCYRRDYIFHLG